MNNYDVKIFLRGLKRVGVALLTAAVFSLSLFGFVATAAFPGYIAVVVFAASLIWLWMTVVLLYAQGLNRVKHKGEAK